MADAASLYPIHPMIWFNRFDILLFSGRATAAMALARDRLGRPQGLDEPGAEKLMALARTIDGRAPAEVDATMANIMGAAGEDLQSAERAIMLASALGHLDEAFAVARSYYFPRRKGPGDPHQPAPDQRHTAFLFTPVMRPMRADPRFDRLMGELGLDRYWRRSGTQPDYRLNS